METSSPGTLAATAAAEGAAVSELDPSSTVVTTESETHPAAKKLMQQAEDVQVLAQQESQDNTKFGKHVTESLKQAEEAMKKVLQAKSSMMKTPSSAGEHASALEKTEWQCKAKEDEQALMMSGSHPCAATATFQSDGALGIFNSLGGSFALAQAKHALAPGCRVEFQSASVEKFAQVMMALSQQVSSCAMITQDSAAALEAMSVLNEQSKNAAETQRADEAQAEATNPELKAAATLYRTAKQELVTAKQDLESRKLMAEKTSAEQKTLAATDGNPDVQRLSQEAHELVESAESEVHASESKVVELTAQVAKLRASYLLETITLKPTESSDEAPNPKSLLQKVGRSLLSLFGLV
jgi:hypothetical protein